MINFLKMAASVVTGTNLVGGNSGEIKFSSNKNASVVEAFAISRKARHQIIVIL
jgi:hypothetical protein